MKGLTNTFLRKMQTREGRGTMLHNATQLFYEEECNLGGLGDDRAVESQWWTQENGLLPFLLQIASNI